MINRLSLTEFHRRWRCFIILVLGCTSWFLNITHTTPPPIQIIIKPLLSGIHCVVLEWKTTGRQMVTIGFDRELHWEVGDGVTTGVGDHQTCLGRLSRHLYACQVTAHGVKHPSQWRAVLLQQRRHTSHFGDAIIQRHLQLVHQS